MDVVRNACNWSFGNSWTIHSHIKYIIQCYGSTFPKVDPDPAKWSGSGWIQIRNTDIYVHILTLHIFNWIYVHIVFSLLSINVVGLYMFKLSEPCTMNHELAVLFLNHFPPYLWIFCWVISFSFAVLFLYHLPCLAQKNFCPLILTGLASLVRRAFTLSLGVVSGSMKGVTSGTLHLSLDR